MGDLSYVREENLMSGESSFSFRDGDVGYELMHIGGHIACW
jgi:hypothetical protein